MRVRARCREAIKEREPHMANCAYCGQNAGFLRRRHADCHDAHHRGLVEMTTLAKRAASMGEFNASALRQRLAEVAEAAFAGEDHITGALERGWEQAVSESLADGILTRDEEERLRNYRDRLALGDAGSRAAMGNLERAAQDRLVRDARHAALAAQGERALRELSDSLDRSRVGPDRRRLLGQAWEMAVDGVLEDGVLTLEEEAALVRYLRHFKLAAADVNANGAHTNMVKAAVIREAAEGLVPQRQTISGRIPFNLMKSEQLVWTIDDVDYHEVVTRRERRGTSHGLSIRIAKGLYYRPGTFRARVHEWEETVHVDTGLLGITTKHLYFHGQRKRFRIRYDRIVSFEPYSDGIGVMRDALTAKPQSFRTGDGWFIYNLATNLARQ